MLPLYDASGRVRPEPWCLYAAFAPTGKNEAYIKVGISTDPLQRVYQINCGSPVPITVALWCHVGKKRHALRIEKFIHRDLEPFKTRGEWLVMDPSSAEHKQVFHQTCQRQFASVTGRLLKWQRNSYKEIVEAMNIVLAMRQK